MFPETECALGATAESNIIKSQNAATENDIARQGFKNVNLNAEPHNQQDFQNALPPFRLPFQKIIARDENTKHNLQTETDMADEMRDFAHILIIVPDIMRKAEASRHKNRKHINIEQQIELLLA